MEVVWTSLWRSAGAECILLSSLCSPYHSCISNLRKGLDVVQCNYMLMFSVKEPKAFSPDVLGRKKSFELLCLPGVCKRWAQFFARNFSSVLDSALAVSAEKFTALVFI